MIEYAVEAEGAEDVETRVMLRDAEGTEVATRTGASGTLRVPNVHKWAPGDGYLYDLEVQLVRGDTVVDSYHQSVGVRTVEVDGIRFLINGEPFYFTGFGAAASSDHRAIKRSRQRPPTTQPGRCTRRPSGS